MLYFQQQWQESWTYLKKFLSLEPEVPGPARSAHFFCARCGSALGRLPEALAHIDASLRLAASADKQVRSEMYLTRGSILAGLEKQEESLRDLQQALALTVLPLQQAEIHYLMGYVGEEQKRYRFALAEYNQALALDPAHWRAYFNRGMLRRDYQEDVPGALADLEQAARLQPDVAVVYYNRAGLYARLKKNAQALADYIRAIDLDPHNGAYYYGRARVYWMLGQWTQAEQDVRRAHEYGHPTGQTRIDPVRQNGPKDNATPR